MKKSNLVITTGGLGPTTDDLTRDAVAEFLQVELLEHQSSLDKILKRYAERGIPMNPISQRQALFPKGANVVNNSAGTADSFWVKSKTTESLIFSFPGVPHEMRVIFQEELLPLLESKFGPLKKPNASYLRCFGLSESAVGVAIEEQKLGERYVVGYRPVFPEVWVKFSGDTLSEKECSIAAEKAAQAIGLAHIISNSFEIPLQKVVLDLLKERNLTVSFAESCTGGLASSLLVSESGSSAAFLGSVICYADEIKINQLGVSPETIKNYGAVSAETALELAKGVRLKTKSSIGISITGIAGPDGGSDKKPIGTVFFGYSREGRAESIMHNIPFERNRIRTYAAHAALDLIRRDLNEFPLHFTRR